MKEILNFSIEEFNISSFDDSYLSKVELYVCHAKHNKNGSYIALENMVKAQNSIHGRPLLYAMNEKEDDFEEHEDSLFASGYIDTMLFPLRYEEKNGKVYLVVSAIVWDIYVPQVVSILKNSDFKGISMEIKVDKTKKRDDGYIEIIDYKYLGIVLLGDKYSTGMYDTDAKMVNFSIQQLDNLIAESRKILKYTLQKNKMKEVQSMKDFNREAHAEKFKLTSNDIRSMMREALYAEGEYYYENYCADYVYAYSSEDKGFVGICYKIEDGKVSLDFGCGKKKNRYPIAR